MKVLVTGASSGIGLAVARRYQALGHHVIACGRNEAALTEFPHHVVSDILSDDLTDHAIAKEVPDLVVNSAGVGLYGSSLDASVERARDLLTLNGTRTIELTILAAKVMREAGVKGTIVNISSRAGYHPIPYLAVYAASKAMLNNFGQSFDVECQDYGIRVLTACPGFVDTPFSERTLGRRVKPPGHVIPVETFVDDLLGQIKRGKVIQIHDWYCRLSTLFSKLFPNAFLARRIMRAIRSRTDIE